MPFVLNLIGTLLLHALALRAPRRLYGALSRLTAGWDRLARHRAVGIAFVFLLALAGSAAPYLRLPLPEPGTHDEFSYLLAADTFLHGRLTNPPHPLWAFFESMHILQQPTCMSKYPPGQGLFLALGTLLTGHPAAGVWLSLALACAATSWMLLAWVSRRWAVLGGVLMALSLAPGPWAQGYWGGAVAALGGALVFGALRRILIAGRWRHGLILGLGLAVLANSRPYEGLVVSLPAAAVLGAWAWRRRGPGARREVATVAVPALAVLAAAGAWMGWYNYRVTGNALCTPYRAHDAAYAAAPPFLWQPPLDHVPEYRHKEMADYYAGFELPRFLRKRRFFGLNPSLFTRLWIFFRFFVGPAFTLPLVVLAGRTRDRWVRFAALTCGLVLLALTQTLYLHPHYAAPVTCLVFFLVVQGLRRVQPWQWRGRPVGRLLVPGTVALLAALLVLPVAQALANPPPGPWPRTRVAQRLEALPGRHLVIVRYGPGHNCHDEWVYNAADIDGSRVVWARDMGPSEDRKLLAYFTDRSAWLLEPDVGPPLLRPYPDH